MSIDEIANVQKGLYSVGFQWYVKRTGRMQVRYLVKGKYYNPLRRIASTRDLTELVEKFRIFIRTGEVGAGTSYSLIGS